VATTTVQPAQPLFETRQPQNVKTRFELELPEPLAASLQDWFERAADVGDINSFAAEVLAVSVIEFRRLNLPPMDSPLLRGDATPACRHLGDDNHKTKLNNEMKDEIRDLRDRGEKVSILAMRFHVSKTAIRRVLKEPNDA
jgi:hypothetical protein